VTNSNISKLIKDGESSRILKKNATKTLIEETLKETVTKT